MTSSSRRRAGIPWLPQLRRALTPDGTLVIVGSEGEVDGSAACERQGSGRRSCRPFVRQTLRTFVAKQNADDLVVLKDLIEAGKVTPVIGGIAYPLSQVPEAMRQLQGGARAGKGRLSP